MGPSSTPHYAKRQMSEESVIMATSKSCLQPSTLPRLVLYFRTFLLDEDCGGAFFDDFREPVEGCGDIFVGFDGCGDIIKGCREVVKVEGSWEVVGVELAGC